MNHSPITWIIVSDGRNEEVHVLKLHEIALQAKKRVFYWSNCDLFEDSRFGEAVERFKSYLFNRPELSIIATSDNLIGKM